MNFTEKNVWTFGTIVCELLDDFFEMFVQSKIEKSGKSDLHFPVQKVWTPCQMIGFSSKKNWPNLLRTKLNLIQPSHIKKFELH